MYLISFIVPLLYQHLSLLRDVQSWATLWHEKNDSKFMGI